MRRGCESSAAPVLRCESLMGGNLLPHRHAQSALSPGAEACWLANGASFSTLSLASCSMSQYFCGDEWRAGWWSYVFWRPTEKREKEIYEHSLARLAACRPPIPPLGCLFSFFLYTGHKQNKRVSVRVVWYC